MSILPQLERDLLDAAERAQRQAPAPHGTSRLRARFAHARRNGGWLHGLRLALLSLAGVFATTAIALAASGAIPIGSSAPAASKLVPVAGVGVPAKGGSRLLSIRASDPEGGIPWGLRLIRTTRGELCIQLGRVEDGKLGELGLDGAFGNDRSFHPVTNRSLPGPDVPNAFASTESTTCNLAGGFAEVEEPSLDRNAASGWLGPPRSQHPPLAHLRDVSYGLLGPHAVSVTYRDGSSERTIPVEQGTGAYLFVLPAKNGRLLHGGAGWGRGATTLAPTSYRNLITKYTYELGGSTCERGAFYGEGKTLAVAHPCPTNASPHTSPPPPRKLHRRVAVKLRVRHGVVVGATVGFKAPFAVTSAGQSYSVAIESCGRHGEGLNQIRAIEPIDRDIERGSGLSEPWSHPFVACDAKSITFEVLYEREAASREMTIVGSASVARSPHTHPAKKRSR